MPYNVCCLYYGNSRWSRNERKDVLSMFLKVDNVDAERMSSGSLFQATWPATQNARLPGCTLSFSMNKSPSQIALFCHWLRCQIQIMDFFPCRRVSSHRYLCCGRWLLAAGCYIVSQPVSAPDEEDHTRRSGFHGCGRLLRRVPFQLLVVRQVERGHYWRQASDI